ncbi:MAG: SDR family NAD(P)-dependent oxidoreductase [Armatimonadetes bacterium]|nr:SDR family NAD(P)-dependent oxidoreductase [Armatimonadota bacterium]
MTLVTGAAGFIGSHLVERLLAEGVTVVGIDNFDPYYARAVKERNLAVALGHPQYTFVEMDLRDGEALLRLIRERHVTRVAHLAARAGVRASLADPRGYAEVNIGGTLAVLEACRAARVCHLVFASSSSVYGDRASGAFREEDETDRPISPYAATKKAGETLCYTYHHLTGMAVTCLRLFTVYGSRQRPDLAIHKFARLMLADRPLPFYGDGSMRRDYTFVSDTLAGMVAALERPNGFQIYNLGRSDPISLADLVAHLERALGRPARLDRQPAPPGDVTSTCADITRAARDLGYAPRVSLEEGLARFVVWLREEVA